MSDTQINKFNFESSTIRVVNINGDPWFIGKEICDLMGIVNTGVAFSELDTEDKQLINHPDMVKMGICNTDDFDILRLMLISEPGLYELVMKSRKPDAKRFKKWVVSEVLPSIRKTGAYGVKPLSRLEMIDQMREIELARIAAEEKAQAFANTIVKQQPKVEYFNRVAVSEEAALNIRDAANRLGFGQNNFVHMMLEKKWLYRAADGRLKAYADKIKSGFLKDKDVVDHNGNSRSQVIFTDKGIAHIVKQKMRPKDGYYEEIIPLFGNTAEDIADAAFAERYLRETQGY